MQGPRQEPEEQQHRADADSKQRHQASCRETTQKVECVIDQPPGRDCDDDGQHEKDEEGGASEFRQESPHESLPTEVGSNAIGPSDPD